MNKLKQHICSLTIFIVLTLYTSCSDSIKIPQKKFPFFLNEPAMLLNQEQDNSFEGNYLKVVSISDSTIEINFPKDFYLFDHDFTNWIVGWGNEKPYYDGGMENCRKILSINSKLNQVKLGKLCKGESLPKMGQNIVFWNTKPGGFTPKKSTLIQSNLWENFSGKSVQFGAIAFDSTLGQWVMLFNEYNSEKVQIYAAVSKDLENWNPYNNGVPVLVAKNFTNCTWSGNSEDGKSPQTPMLNDVIRYNGVWYLLVDGYDKQGKQHIGFIKAKNKLTGPFEISKNPIVSPGKSGSWNDKSCFYGKIIRHQDHFLLFYSAWNTADYAQLGLTSSKDLINFTEQKAVLSSYSGWRSNSKTNLPVYLESSSDSLFLLLMGTKSFSKTQKGKSGNVDDAQLGVFLSTNKGENFMEHINNPVFVNDYTSDLENEHTGGNFKRIQTDSADYIFYHGKSSVNGWKYNVLQRKKLKK